MSLGTTLTSYRDAKGGNKQVAPLLHERWPHLDARPEISTISSRLSELVAEKPRGVKFFFDDLAVAGLLLDTLEVPAAERDRLLDEAKGVADGKPSAKLIIEVSALSTRDRDTTDRLFKLVEQAVPDRLAPVAVVLVEDQYRWLPRSIEPPRFIIHRVPDPQAGRAKAAELADRRGLLWSPHRGDTPAERWAAVRFDGFELETYPEAALGAYATAGRLVVPAPPAASLQSLGVQGDGSAAPDDPLALRKLFEQLPDPEFASKLGKPARRVALAQELGILAAATERECIEADIARIAAELTLVPVKSDDAKLAALLERAARRLVPATLLRIGDDLHAVNAPAARAGGRLRVHNREPQPAMITRLRAAVATRTYDDWEADRFLDQGFVPGEGESLAFETARAGLLYNLYEIADSPADTAWAEALAALLRGAPPAARLYLAPVPTDALARPFAVTGAEFSDRFQEKPEATRGYWQRWPALPSITACREDDVFIVGPELKGPTGAHPLIPAGEATTSDSGLWLDALDVEEEARALSDAYGRRAKRGQYIGQHPDELLGDHAWDPWVPARLFVSAEKWREADHALALLWIALRRAARPAAGTTLHDGTGLLPLGAGVFAVVFARKHGAPDAAVGAALHAQVSTDAYNRAWRLEKLLLPVVTHTAETSSYRTEAGPSLPRGLRLTGKGWVIDITFVGSALFADERANEAAVGGAMAAAAALPALDAAHD